MAFSAVSWKYRDPVTSAKLAQMVENIVAHDHRLDGTQGAAAQTGAVAAGIVTETRAAAGAVTTAVAFPAGRFSSPPRVFVTCDISTTALVVTSWSATDVTATGFNVRVFRNNATATPVHWVAIERTT